MIIKKFSYILIFFFLTSCGYQAIYSKKNNTSISINKIESIGDRNINRKIISLANLKERNNQNYSYDLTLSSTKIIEAVAKDKTGNTSVYKTTIVVEFYLKDPNNQGEIFKKKIFSSSFSYNNINNKFDLVKYQKNIEQNLIEKIAEEITIFLSL
jgi:hypothetical protein|tara:strand:- start:657 stop:1121 length:465 start_codon:yes stop_codon:yes gene_type:complete